MLNIILIILIMVMAGVTLWWALNTVRKIQTQREFATFNLISILKLWRKAKYVPEDARDRESLYLYRDFLKKFDEDDTGKFPLMVKDGGIRCMTRREYDQLHQQNSPRPFSLLILIASGIYAVLAIALNLNNLLIGFGLALVMPIVQVVAALLITKFNQEKNQYRNRIFADLKANSVDFLRMTKPFIIVDAYPQRFGKAGEPRFIATGEITDKQMNAVKRYIIQQKSAETRIVVQPVDNSAEIQAIRKPESQISDTEAQEIILGLAADHLLATMTPEELAALDVAAPTETAVDTDATPADDNAPVEQTTTDENTTTDAKATTEENATANENAAPDTDAAAAETEAPTADAAAPTDQAPTDAPLETATEPAAPAEPAEPELPQMPDEDDFSLDAIGQALDAEIARRQLNKPTKKSKKS